MSDLHICSSRTKKTSNSKISYSSEAMQRDIERIKSVWEYVQSNRDRFAIYEYLTAVFELIAWWAVEGQSISRASRCLRLYFRAGVVQVEPFAAIIVCTSDREKVNSKTRSKWSRALRYAAAVKLSSESLKHFMQRLGGINACAARYTRRTARLARDEHS